MSSYHKAVGANEKASGVMVVMMMMRVRVTYEEIISPSCTLEAKVAVLAAAAVVVPAEAT